MFERFTKEARDVVRSAVEMAAGQGNGRVEAEHLLLGVARTARSGPAARVLDEFGATAEALAAAVSTENRDAELLARLGIDLDEVRRSVERKFGEGSWTRRRIHRGHIPFTAEAKKSLELSLRHALALHSRTIEAQHILLGVLDSGPGIKGALSSVGTDPQKVKRRLVDLLKATT